MTQPGPEGIPQALAPWPRRVRCLGCKMMGPANPLAEFWRRVKRLPLEIVPVDAGQWLASVALDWEHRDPADRVIVALAREREAGLVTCDRRMGSFYDGCVW